MLQKSVAVTGANGYIGLHLVQNFLQNNFNVVATVRDSTNTEKIQDLLKLPNQQNLKIVSADLQSPEGYIQAFKGVDAVVHNAALVAINAQLGEDDFVKPAMAGVENVITGILENKSTIKNIIYMSSMSAVCGAPGSRPADHKFSSNDWSDAENQRERKVWYSLSKTLAELKFKEYAEKLKQENNIKYVSICPTLVIGPILQSFVNTSVEQVVNFLRGQKDVIPNYAMSLVDVRDVAEMSYQAINKNIDGRFISVEQGYTFEQIVDLLRKHGGELSKNLPTKVAEGDKATPSLFELEESQQLMGRPFISADESIKDMIISLKERNLL